MPHPMPVPDSDSAPFWDACRKRELRVPRCLDCGTTRFPPHGHCPRCGSAKHDWLKCAGRGRVYSWIVVVQPIPKEVFANDVPYVVALVDLPEGVRIPTNIVGCDPHAVKADMAVEVVFEDVSPTITLPKFRPVGAKA
ncbi:MAG: hypothetical protein FJX47_10335 [Alphaproteobacteria bacterium]|nr:hypothetical protein [Alphaproteobacteria bacterium]